MLFRSAGLTALRGCSGCASWVTRQGRAGERRNNRIQNTHGGSYCVAEAVGCPVNGMLRRRPLAASHFPRVKAEAAQCGRTLSRAGVVLSAGADH